MTAPRLLALDLSLTATGCACTGSDGRLYMHTVRSRHIGHERLQDICTHVAAACRRVYPDLVVIEGLYVGQRNNTLELAELHGLVKQQLWLTGVPYVLVAPTTLKLYAAGNGRADKATVRIGVEERYDRTCGDDNQADALALLGMAADHYGQPIGKPVLDKCRRALDSVKWPALNIPASPPGGPPHRSAPPGGGEWSVNHPGIGVLPYPDEAAARAHAGTAGTVIPPA